MFSFEPLKRTEGSAREVLNQIRTGPHFLILSPFILDEVARVLDYPRLQAIWPLDRTEVKSFVDGLYEVAEIVEFPLGSPGVEISKDPDDNPIIQTAVDGHADVLCTLDKHIRHPNVQTYCSNRGIQILSDVDLLRLFREEVR